MPDISLEEQETMTVQPTIAAAAMVVVAPGLMSPGKDLAKRMEAAMSQAILDANAEGISVENTAVIKERMAAAREKAKQDFYAPLNLPVD